jgi:hypothetical protein
MTSVGCLAVMGAVSGSPGGSSPDSLVAPLLEALAGGALRVAAGVAVLALLWWPFVVAATVGAWLVFAKAGRPGWACLVPGYNGAEFLRVAKLPAWLCLAFLVPVVNVVLHAAACVRVARAFRKGPAFAVGLALLPPVYMIILGMGPARYRRFEVVAGEAADPEPDEPRASPSSRTPARTSSTAAPVPLVALPGHTSTATPGRVCGAGVLVEHRLGRNPGGEPRVAAGGDRRGQPRGRDRSPLSPARPRLHLV